MPIYMIIQSKIKDRKHYDQYIDKVSPIVQKYGGRYLARGEDIKAFGSWKPDRVIIIEFDSEVQIQKWLTSPEYAAIAPLREGGADAQAIIIEGYQNETE